MIVLPHLLFFFAASFGGEFSWILTLSGVMSSKSKAAWLNTDEPPVEKKFEDVASERAENSVLHSVEQHYWASAWLDLCLPNKSSIFVCLDMNILGRALKSWTLSLW